MKVFLHVLNIILLFPLIFTSVTGLQCYHMNKYGESHPAHCRGYCASISAELEGGNKADVNYCIPERICLATKSYLELKKIGQQICKGLSRNTQDTGRIKNCNAAVCQKHLCNNYNFKTSVSLTNCSIPLCFNEACYDGPPTWDIHTTSKPSPTTPTSTLSTSQMVNGNNISSKRPTDEKSSTNNKISNSVTSTPKTSRPSHEGPMRTTEPSFISFDPYEVPLDEVTTAAATTTTTPPTTPLTTTNTTVRSDQKNETTSQQKVRNSTSEEVTPTPAPEATSNNGGTNDCVRHISRSERTSFTSPLMSDFKTTQESGTTAPKSETNQENNEVERISYFIGNGVTTRQEYLNNVAQTRTPFPNSAWRLLYSFPLLFPAIILTSL